MCQGTLMQDYICITLNNVQIKSKTMKLISNNICTASLINLILNGYLINDGEFYYKNEKLNGYNSVEKIIFKKIKINENGKTFNQLLTEVKNLNSDEISVIVNHYINESLISGNIEIINSLIECDLNYETSGIEIQEYRTSYDNFNNLIKKLREAIFSDDNLSCQNYCLIWLLIQSGDLFKILEYSEKEVIYDKLKINMENLKLIEDLNNISNIDSLLLHWKKFVENKNKFFSKGFALGLNSRFPALERREAIFISTEKMFSSDSERLDCVIGKLTDKGHMCNVISGGRVPIVQIDNVKYELVPDAIRMKLINIHGVRLRRHNH